MSQVSLDQLTKKNQEFIHTATKLLIQKGKTDQEIKEILESILPTILEQQKTGTTARNLYGSPTTWVNSLETPTTVKENTPENDTPVLMFTDSFLFVFGAFAALTGLMNFFSSQSTTYGFITLLTSSLAGGGALYAMYYYIYRLYEQGQRPNLIRSLIVSLISMGIWVLLISTTMLLPSSINPQLPGWLMLSLGILVLALRFYLKKRYNIKSALQSRPRP